MALYRVGRLAFSRRSPFLLLLHPCSALLIPSSTPKLYLRLKDRLTNRPKVRLQVRPRLLDTPRLIVQIRLAGAVLAGLPAAQGARRRHFLRVRGGRRRASGGGAGAGLLQGRQQLLGRLGRQVLVVVVVDLDHGRVDAGAQALHLDEGEQAVGRRLSLLDPQLLFNCRDDLVAAAAA